MYYEPPITKMGAKAKSRYAQNERKIQEHFKEEFNQWEEKRRETYFRILAKNAQYINAEPVTVSHREYEAFSKIEDYETHNLVNGGPKPPDFENKSMSYVNRCLNAMNETILSAAEWRETEIVHHFRK